jgi:hypothetical protein
MRGAPSIIGFMIASATAFGLRSRPGLGSWAAASGTLAFAGAGLPFMKFSSTALVQNVAVLLGTSRIRLWGTSSATGTLLAVGSSTTETAIGLPHPGRARQSEALHNSPHQSKEMIFRALGRGAEKLRQPALNGAFMFPLLTGRLQLSRYRCRGGSGRAMPARTLGRRSMRLALYR